MQDPSRVYLKHYTESSNSQIKRQTTCSRKQSYFITTYSDRPPIFFLRNILNTGFISLSEITQLSSRVLMNKKFEAAQLFQNTIMINFIQVLTPSSGHFPTSSINSYRFPGVPLNPPASLGSRCLANVQFPNEIQNLGLEMLYSCPVLLVQLLRPQSPPPASPPAAAL